MKDEESAFINALFNNSFSFLAQNLLKQPGGGALTDTKLTSFLLIFFKNYEKGILMRARTIVLAMSLAVGSAIGPAFATPVTNLVTNGDFSAVSGGLSSSTQFGTLATVAPQQFITGWTGNNGYEIWYPSANAAVTENANGQYSYTDKEKLWGASAPPSGPGTFIGLDGDQTNGFQASIAQVLHGLTIGSTYQVSFDWAGAQMQSSSGATTESLAVSLGSQTHDLTALSNTSEGFTGWQTASPDFVASSTYETLRFLAVGSPFGLKPFSLLTNVSVTEVPAKVSAQAPEPGSLALLGSGLIGLGLVLSSRRRKAGNAI